jgi:hypothetical protein
MSPYPDMLRSKESVDKDTQPRALPQADGDPRKLDQIDVEALNAQQNTKQERPRVRFGRIED